MHVYKLLSECFESNVSYALVTQNLMNKVINLTIALCSLINPKAEVQQELSELP